MTQATQQQDAASNFGPSLSNNDSDSPTTHLSSLLSGNESASDNDTSERPVREKLKKTSLGSIPKNSAAHSQPDADSINDSKAAHQNPEPDISGGLENSTNSLGSRGRSIRKRSFDDLETNTDNTATDQSVREHVRKRSREVLEHEDVKADEDARGICEDVKVYGRERGVILTTAQEDNKHKLETCNMDESGSGKETLIKIATNAASSSLHDIRDQEMRDSAFSPRKKRSRDQFDTETYREQKIAATEETKAHRRSEENEREGIPQNANKVEPSKEHFATHGNDHSTKEAVKQIDVRLTSSKEPSTTDTRSPSALASHQALGENDQLQRRPSNLSSTDLQNQKSQASAIAFASSGFAALSGSSTSPFGTLAAPHTSTSTSTSGFASAAANGLGGPGSSDFSGRSTEPAVTNTFISTGATTTSGFGVIGASAFGASGALQLGGLGSSGFGSGFSSGFGGATRLTSFAAPTGDTNWGGESGSARTFGAPVQDLEEEDHSESEVELESVREEGSDGKTSKFQHKDVSTGEDGEDCIFSSPRTNLYSFNKGWKERGRGTFKFNVTALCLDAQAGSRKSGRFVMRALQTYRVLLNEPVFKQMTVGDAKGNEPSGKSFSFAVIEEGRPIPYMIKMSDEEESKTLYREVRKLQEQL